MSEVNFFSKNVKGGFIMSLVDEDTKNLDDKKEAVVTTPFLDKK